ncbi:methionine--tRNA ligase [Sphingomonas sp. HDW15A]|uniref:methionine--tRNA ligase n=1 Tax=Sphingomonas sp. HDW15A TaxID=2714942 RepID=UPI00140D08EE|nr:methionine--tRNA ligase [Sphingomonas sp. HDW15A]QIK96061.1 methionine--tRNA ligase [Sphingomonas sp. HDW15A]
MAEPFYITTAISYPNGKPHIGHAYEAIAADVIARFQRAQGRDVRLVTGTDEHGLKMVQTARAEGVDTRTYADKMSQYFRMMCDDLNISYDAFVRTTEQRHADASIAIWKAMEAAGDLYLDRYEGWYSVRDEAFYDESELVGEGDERRSPQGTPVEWTVEETWFFRLSKYQDRLVQLYRDNPAFIQPDSRRNEVVRFVEGGLKDLSVSRTSFDWGVPVPGSPGHVMYVWVDALTTYMTGVGYPQREGDYDRFWPADIHLIGKDIVRFHAVYWPAFLMSANLPLPKQVYGHGFLLARGGEKMSKSAGNVVDPMELADRFGVDNLRYFLMREISFGQDGSYSAEAIVTRCNAELANSFGNLAQRTLSMIFKNLEGVLPEAGKDEADRSLLDKVHSACRDLDKEFAGLAFSQGLDAWMSAVFACNAYVDETAPWALKKGDPERMAAVLGTLVVAIRALAVAVHPVIPASAERLITLIDSGKAGAAIAQPSPIFPRLELPEDAEKPA